MLEETSSKSSAMPETRCKTHHTNSSGQLYKNSRNTNRTTRIDKRFKPLPHHIISKQIRAEEPQKIENSSPILEIHGTLEKGEILGNHQICVQMRNLLMNHPRLHHKYPSTDLPLEICPKSQSKEMNEKSPKNTQKIEKKKKNVRREADDRRTPDCRWCRHR